MIVEPNIVISSPHIPDSPSSQGSPIDKFHMLEMNKVASEFIALLNGDEFGIGSCYSNTNREQKINKLNIGEKIKNKMENTNKKSVGGIKEKESVSEFNCDNKKNEEYSMSTLNNTHK
jgi:hypothetical protein